VVVPLIAVAVGRVITVAAAGVAAAAVAVTVGLSRAAVAVLGSGRHARNAHRGHNQSQRRPAQRHP
jgi:hypothetical protein